MLPAEPGAHRRRDAERSRRAGRAAPASSPRRLELADRSRAIVQGERHERLPELRSRTTCWTGACCRSCVAAGGRRWWPRWPTPCSAGRLERDARRLTRGSGAPGVAAAIAVMPRPDEPQPAGRRDHQRRRHSSAAGHARNPFTPLPGADDRKRRLERNRPPQRLDLDELPSSSSARARPRRARRRLPPASAETDHAGEAEGARPLPRDRAVRRRAGAVAEGTPPQPAQLTTYKDLKRSTNRCPPRQRRSSCSWVRARARGKERGVHARRRSDPARAARRACRAPRSARRSTCRSARPRSSNTVEPSGTAGHLRTEGREHRQERERRVGRARARAPAARESKAGRELLRTTASELCRAALLAAARACSCSPRRPAAAARAHVATQRRAPQALSPQQIS